MPHKVVQSQPSIRSIGTQVVAKCFCEKQNQGSSCFSSLPDHIQSLINEHYVSSGQTRQDCVCEPPPAEFTLFPDLPSSIQKQVIQCCLPPGQIRYLESLGAAAEDSRLTLLRHFPCAARASSQFYNLFKEQWKGCNIGAQDSSSSTAVSTRSYVNFTLDKLVIDVNRPLISVSRASYVVQHSSSQRQARLPVNLTESWAHNKAEAEIRSLPDEFFTAMPRLETYWLVINDLAIGNATRGNAEPDCRCVFAPMIKCMTEPVTTKFHAFRYHVRTGKVTCAEMNRDHEADVLLAACAEKNPNFAARVTFVYNEDELLDTSDGLDWWHLPAWSLFNFKYEKLKKRLDWGLVTDVLQHHISYQRETANGL